MATPRKSRKHDTIQSLDETTAVAASPAEVQRDVSDGETTQPEWKHRIAKADVATALARGALGAIPIVGSLASEVLGLVIPDRRLERIETLLADLGAQLGDRRAEDIRERFTSPEFVDILEDAMAQSARALSDERIHRIAALLKNSLTDAELKHLQDKRLLELLAQINDAELIILQSYELGNVRHRDWHEKHKDIIAGPRTPYGSPQTKVDEATIHKQFRENLKQLGLLEPRYPTRVKGEFPELDDRTGLPKISGYTISRLGQVLLRRTDLLGANEP